MKPTNNGYKVLIVILLIIIAVLSFKLYKENNLEKAYNENLNVQESTVLESTTTSENIDENLVSNNIISLVQKKYIEKNLLKQDNIEFWNITSLKKIGYFDDGTNVYYLTGVFKCRDGNSDCIYMTQYDDTNSTIPFAVYVKEKNNEIELGLTYFECSMSEETIKASGDEEYCSKFHLEN